MTRSGYETHNEKGPFIATSRAGNNTVLPRMNFLCSSRLSYTAHPIHHRAVVSNSLVLVDFAAIGLLDSLLILLTLFITALFGHRATGFSSYTAHPIHHRAVVSDSLVLVDFAAIGLLDSFLTLLTLFTTVQ